jgi:hypothetical protein
VAIYYVAKNGSDSNNGTSTATPFLTIQKGYSVCNAGDICFVRTGTYSAKVSMNRNGTSGSPITLMAYPDEFPIIDGSGGVIGSNYSETLVDIGGSYNVIDGFEIRNCTPVVQRTGEDNLYLVQAFTSNYNTVRNCHIHHGWGVGVNLLGTGHLIEDCLVHDVAQCSLYMNNGNWPGAVVLGTTFSNNWGVATNCTARRVKSYRNGGEGILIMNASYTTVEDCESRDNFAVNIHCTDSDHSLVRRNIVYHTSDGDAIPWVNGTSMMAARGMCLSNEYGPSAVGGFNNQNPNQGIGNVIVNNIIYGTGKPFSVWSYWATALQNNVVAFNSFVDGRVSGRGADAYIVSMGWPGGGSVSGNVFRNNVIDSTVSGVAVWSGSTTGWTLDHNIWRLTPSGLSLDGASTVANPNLTRTGSVGAGTLDVEFFRPLAGSWCYTHATAVSGVTDDLLQVTRSGTPTVGALEDSAVSDYETTAAPWITDDIGSTPSTGTDEYSPSLTTYRQVGYGADMWGTADAFCFTYREITGDFTFQYRVVSASPAGTYSKAGCDVRVALTAGSRHVSLNQIPGGTIQRLIRSADGGATSAANATTANTYHRVVRSGNTLTTYHSADNLSWTTVATDDITGWGTTLYVGRIACPNDAAASITVLFDNVALSAYEDAIGTMSFGFDLAGVSSPTAIREATGTISFGFDLLGNTASASIIDAIGTISIDFLLNGVADPNIGDVSDTTIFGNYKRALIGTVPQTTYGPVTAGTQSSLLGCAISNRKAAIVKVSVALVNGANTYYRAYNLPIQPNAVLYPFASGLRLDLKPGDKLVVSADQESAVDSVVSYVERPP